MTGILTKPLLDGVPMLINSFKNMSDKLLPVLRLIIYNKSISPNFNFSAGAWYFHRRPRR